MERKRKITVLAFGEGEREKIFLRYVSSCYIRTDKVSIAISSAGGGSPQYILDRAIRYRSGQKRDIEFIMLDTDKKWPQDMIKTANDEGIQLIGSSPCIESFLLEILNMKTPVLNGGSSARYKEHFEELCINRRFDEDECRRLFPKATLNSAKERISELKKIITIIEGGHINLEESNL